MSDRNQQMIQAIDLTKRFSDGRAAVNRLTFNVRPGEIYVLLGAPGSGKSTVLSLFMNFISPTSGVALIDGSNCTTQADAVKRVSAYVPEISQSHETLSAWRYYSYLMRLGGKSGYGRNQSIRDLRESDLPEKVFDAPFSDLTPGMRQLLVLGSVMKRDAKAVLFDEPIAGMDARSVSLFIARLRKLKEEGRAILIVTHDLLLSNQIADVVGILSQGVLSMEASAESKEVIRDVFLQTASFT